MTRQRVLALVFGLVVALGSGVPAVYAQAPVSPGGSGGGPKEGIKVHGHWTIEVRQPDGTLLTRHDFENAVTATGRSYLVWFLAQARTAGLWSVTVSGPLCSPDAFGNSSCKLVQADSLHSEGGNIFKNLTVGLGNALFPSSLTLSGSFTAASAGNVSSVGTGLGICNPLIEGPANCTASTLTPNFSGTTLSTPVDVQAGQIVQITVVFSFS